MMNNCIAPVMLGTSSISFRPILAPNKCTSLKYMFKNILLQFNSNPHPCSKLHVGLLFVVGPSIDRTGNFLVCWEKTNQDILANLGTIYGELLPYCFLLRQTIKVEAFFQWWLAFKQHNTNLHQPKNTHHRADFRKMLQFTCELITDTWTQGTQVA